MTKRIKIIFFIDSLKIGGMHKQILYIVKHLNKDVFEPVMCTQIPIGGLREDFEKVGCKLFDLGWKRKYDLSTISRLIKILDQERPDIIFITEPQPLFYYQIARLFWHRKVVQIGSFRALTFWKGHLKKYYRLIDNIFSRWLYYSSECVVVNSLAMKDNYSQKIKINPTNPLRVIYNGSDFDFPITRSTMEIRKELKIGINEIMIIMVARLDPWKDYDTLLESAKIIIEFNRTVKLFLIGNGMLKKRLEQKIIQMKLQKNVFLIGEKKDIYNYINTADISVLSTNGEGFSNSILESMALCKPVIATDVGSNNELLGISGESGFIITPKSPKIFADKIVELINDKNKRHKMGELAKIRIHKICDIKNYITSYQDLFLESMKQ